MDTKVLHAPTIPQSHTNAGPIAAACSSTAFNTFARGWASWTWPGELCRSMQWENVHGPGLSRASSCSTLQRDVNTGSSFSTTTAWQGGSALSGEASATAAHPKEEAEVSREVLKLKEGPLRLCIQAADKEP